MYSTAPSLVSEDIGADPGQTLLVERRTDRNIGRLNVVAWMFPPLGGALLTGLATTASPSPLAFFPPAMFVLVPATWLVLWRHRRPLAERAAVGFMVALLTALLVQAQLDLAAAGDLSAWVGLGALGCMAFRFPARPLLFGAGVALAAGLAALGFHAHSGAHAVALVASGAAFVSLGLLGEERSFLESVQAQAYTRELEHLALRDPLTQLFNRRFANENLDKQLRLALRGARSLSVLVLDIDHFKQINDTFGHAVGDRVLVGVARLFAAQLRTSDVIARIGGEEFLVVLPDTDEVGAQVVAERLRASMRQLEWVGHPQQVTVSVGVAGALAEDTVEQLFERADRALYRAKGSGRNRVCVAPDPNVRPVLKIGA